MIRMLIVFVPNIFAGKVGDSQPVSRRLRASFRPDPLLSAIQPRTIGPEIPCVFLRHGLENAP